MCPLWLIQPLTDLLLLAEALLVEVLVWLLRPLPWWAVLWICVHLDLIIASLLCSAALLLAWAHYSSDE